MINAKITIVCGVAVPVLPTTRLRNLIGTNRYNVSFVRRYYRTDLTTKRSGSKGGGTGVIMGRKAFQKPMEEGVALIRAVQDVYLSDEVTVA